MYKFLKEPLIHFALLAMALFLLFQLVSKDSSSVPDQQEEIVVTQGRIQALSQRFEKVWQRPPTSEERNDLIQDHIREEVFYREALAMGLDRDDTIVRRRLRQKLEFLSEDLAGPVEPEEEELQAFLADHSENYREQTRFSFRQVFLDASKRGQVAQGDAVALLAKLQTGDVDAAKAGDSLMLIKRVFDNEPEREVVRTLGHQFLESLHEIPTGSWQGPIASGFGIHLIYMHERVEGSVPALVDVRDAVLRDWRSVKTKETNEQFYQRLAARYKVTVVEPKAPTTTRAAMGLEK